MPIALCFVFLVACTSAAAPGAERTRPPTVVLGKGAGGGVAAPAMPGVNVPAVKVDTVGYPTTWRKIAVVNVEPTEVRVVNDGNEVVLRPKTIAARGIDEASQDPTWQVDFTELRTPGVYTLHVGEHASDPFRVAPAEELYAEALLAGVKSFYFQRTRTALTGKPATWKGDAYTRKTASHVHDDVGWDLEDYPAKKRKWKVEGGWHDAGNYDMYVPSTAPSAHTLLMAYEWDPSLFDDAALVLPESGNGVPDILDEARWGIVWVLSMQEPSGAFRHREAVMEWTPEGPADEDKTVRWIAGPSSSATAKAVAVLAMASRIYGDVDPKFAQRCERAARKGWAWLVAHPEHVRADGKGSKQPLWDDEPENTDVGARFVAAVEMWRTFRDRDALAAAQALMDAEETQATAMWSGAWANLSRWGLIALATDDDTPAAVRREARARVLAAADAALPRVEQHDGYRCLSAPADYYWAHNSNLMEKTHVLAVAARLTSDERYLHAARDQWHWVLGRNPNGYSMVTRVGKGPTRLYHMEWGDHDPPPPGFLIGGPNGQNMAFLAPGAPAKALLWDNPAPLRSGLPAHAMWHWRQSDLWDGGFVAEGEWTDGWWAVTEPDILYSAGFVLAAVSVR